MVKVTPPESLTPTPSTFMSELNECQRRHCLAQYALSLGRHGISKISEKSGRKAMLPRHPEWLDTFKAVIEPHLADLPQGGNVFWVSLTVPQIRQGMVIVVLIDRK